MTTEPHDQRSGVGRRLANNARGDAGPFCDASKLGNTGSCSCTKGMKIRSATMRRLCQQRVPNQQASNRSRDAKPRKPFIVIKRRPGFEHVPEEDPHGGRCGPGNGSCPSGQATKGELPTQSGTGSGLVASAKASESSDSEVTSAGDERSWRRPAPPTRERCR